MNVAARFDHSRYGQSSRVRPGGCTKATPIESGDMIDSITIDAAAETVDRALHANLARFTGGLSPGALATAYFDWLTHLPTSPGKQSQLVQKAIKKWARAKAA